MRSLILLFALLLLSGHVPSETERHRTEQTQPIRRTRRAGSRRGRRKRGEHRGSGQSEQGSDDVPAMLCAVRLSPSTAIYCEIQY